MFKKITILIFILGLFLPLSSASAFTILSTNNYAWSDNVGWINFAPVNAGVTVTDSALSGHAWSENKGYINLAPAQGGVFNDGTGNLSGSAWGEQLGYIDFNGVSINETTGKFSGTATGTLVGTITFDCTFCDVETDWRPASPPGGGGSGSRRVLPNSEVLAVNPNSLIIPNIPDTGLTTEIIPSPGAPGGNSSPSSLVASAGVPLFDVIAEPAFSTQNNNTPLTIFSIIVGASILLSGLLAAKFIFIPPSLRVAYYNGTETAGLSGILEKIIQKQFSHFKTVSLSSASATHYKGNTVVDLSGRHGKEAAKMAKLINGVVAPMPAGEIKPDADILVISGH